MKFLKKAMLVGASILVLGACGREEVAETTKEITPTIPVETTTEPETTVSREGMMPSYLTGEWVHKEVGNRRPVAVMLNNIKTAVPQSGIEKAGVVYEAPVEGGITRLMGIFEEYDDLAKIGSVRSARTYYVYFAKEFDSIYVHYGEANYATPLLSSSDIQNLSGLEGVGNVVYYRTTDRKAPHNAYTSAEGLQKGIEAMKYRTDFEDGYTGHYKFAEDGENITLTNGSPVVKLAPGYTVNSPWFEYNSEDELFYRFQYNDKQIDQETAKQLAYKNIIMQISDTKTIGDTEYLDITVSGSGKGKYLTNGQVV
ncbi:MAG: DUF3048 domain-containing protein, partial [Clostridiales bacterium]|nr:DUF3048 domain-containing protein [Clostridiales bacterium]